MAVKAMIYRIGASIVEAGLRLHALPRGRATLRQRLALPPPERADIWLHVASVGELASAGPVIEALARSHSILVTTNTLTARDMAQDRGWAARLAPLDAPGALSRFLEGTQPRLQITVENEFWPLRSRMLADRAIPQAMIGARMSQRSARRWARLPGMIRPVLGRLAALSAQDADSEARMRSLGLPPDAILPRLDLKLLTPARVTPPPPSPRRDRTFLAVSTHEGEEGIVLDAWTQARRDRPDLRLILAIRHPRRGDEVAALLAGRGLPCARRSAGEAAGDVVLVDVLGEMDRWYAAAGLCLVGGSLTDRGGHTPWEPAAHRCAILHGPHVSNFRDAYVALDGAGAAQAVDASSLAGHLARLAADPAQARSMGQAARHMLDDRTADPGALIDRLRRLAGPPRRSDIGTARKGHDR